MLTGATLYLYLQQKWTSPVTAWLTTNRGNRLLRETLYRVLEKKYRGLETQKEYDELSVLIKTNKVYTPDSHNFVSTLPVTITALSASAAPNSVATITTYLPHNFILGQSVTLAAVSGITGSGGTAPTNVFNTAHLVTSIISPTQFQVTLTNNILTGTYTANSGNVYATNSTITDYYHYLTSKAKFRELLPPVITGVTAAADMVVTTGTRHNLRVEDEITISGVTGTGSLPTNINATHTILEIVNAYSFKVAASGVGGTYTSGGTISRTYYEECIQLTSNEKIGKFGEPSRQYPRVEFAENYIKIYGNKLGTETCYEFTADYIAKPQLEINLADAVTDLEMYWNPKLLYFLCDEAVLNFAGQIRDGQLQQTEMQATIDNP